MRARAHTLFDESGEYFEERRNNRGRTGDVQRTAFAMGTRNSRIVSNESELAPACFPCFAFFFPLSYFSLNGADRPAEMRAGRSCTLERRSANDCCHYCDPRPRGPSRCHALFACVSRVFVSTHGRAHKRSARERAARTRDRESFLDPINRLTNYTQ